MENEHQEPSNPYDELFTIDVEADKKALADQKAAGEKIDQLIHQAFSQNEAGAELINLWTETLIMSPTAQPGQDLIEIGINEGIKQFIRNIRLTIQKVEKGE